MNRAKQLLGGTWEGRGITLLCPVRKDPKRPPGRPTHRNAKARFIVGTVQASRDLVKATGVAAASGGILPF